MPAKKDRPVRVDMNDAEKLMWYSAYVQKLAQKASPGNAAQWAHRVVTGFRAQARDAAAKSARLAEPGADPTDSVDPHMEMLLEVYGS